MSPHVFLLSQRQNLGIIIVTAENSIDIGKAQKMAML